MTPLAKFDQTYTLNLNWLLTCNKVMFEHDDCHVDDWEGILCEELFLTKRAALGSRVSRLILRL